jgi:tetratricopeptide (TPR) repeat protein
MAIEFYSRAIELDAKATLAWANRGVIRVHRNEYELAKSDWQKAIASDPSHNVSKILQPLVQNNLITYFRQHPQLKDLWATLNSPAVACYLV